MLYAVTSHLVALTWKMLLSLLPNLADDDSTADAWVKQQTRLRKAIALAKSQNASAMPPESEDEWVDPWVRQQMRLKEAIARAKREGLGG